MQFRKPYDREAEQAARAAARTVPQGESKTQQQFRKDCDLNEIVRRMGATGQPIPTMPADPAAFGNFVGAPLDLREALLRMKNAEVHFLSLPAKIRRQFDNNPLQFLDWVQDPDNEDEAVQMGLRPSSKPVKGVATFGAGTTPPDMPKAPEGAAPASETPTNAAGK